jgi:uncharacterized membrane protein YhaH (DUF805 family)
MENPYAAPRGHIAPPPHTPGAPLTWKQILFSFTGRIPRRIFWGVSLVSQAIFYALSQVLESNPDPVTAIVVIALWLPMLWIGLAITVKRWHDRDKPGWWIFIIFIPIVGAIWYFIECACLRGTEGPNQFGDDPT